MKRRSFLRSGGVLGLAWLAPPPAHGAVPSHSSAASPGPQSPDALENLLRELESTGPRFYNVPRADAEFLHLLVKAIQARRVLEIDYSVTMPSPMPVACRIISTISRRTRTSTR